MTQLFIALGVFSLMALLFGLLLGFSSIKFKVEDDPIVEKIDQKLPQTQCGQCGYPGCRPYAQAVADGDAVNKCVPGGEETMHALAQLMGVEPQPMSSNPKPEKKVAFIHEDQCIGCTKCIQACPVDAIVGAPRMMHTIIEQECTGCDLCVDPCPTDCIEMIPVKVTPENWQWDFNKIPVKQI